MFKFNYLGNKIVNKKNNGLQDQYFKKRQRTVHVSSVDNMNMMNTRFPSIEFTELVDITHEAAQYLSELASKINDYYGMQVSFCKRNLFQVFAFN